VVGKHPFLLLLNSRLDISTVTGAQAAQHVHTSLLLCRRHPPPSERKLGEFKAAAQMLGVTVDSSSAGTLQASLNAIRAACQDDAAREVRQLTQVIVRFVNSVVHCCTLPGVCWQDASGIRAACQDDAAREVRHREAPYTRACEAVVRCCAPMYMLAWCVLSGFLQDVSRASRLCAPAGVVKRNMYPDAWY
jgi:hypothetical protein